MVVTREVWASISRNSPTPGQMPKAQRSAAFGLFGALTPLRFAEYYDTAWVPFSKTPSSLSSFSLCSTPFCHGFAKSFTPRSDNLSACLELGV